MSELSDLMKNPGLKVVRSLTAEHVHQLVELYDEEWPSQTRTIADMKQAIDGAEFVIGIVEQKTEALIGFCRVVSDRGFRAWIHGLVVRESNRGSGLGKLLMDQVLVSPELQGIHSVGLTCAPSMVEFYRKWGFQVRKSEVVMNLSLRSKEG